MLGWICLWDNLVAVILSGPGALPFGSFLIFSLTRLGVAENFLVCWRGFSDDCGFVLNF